MKYIITESQHKRLFEEEQQVLHIHDIKVFGGWDNLQRFLESKGNPPYSIGGDLDLRETPIESLGNLQSVGGYLDLEGTLIKSLGNLQSVGGYLDLRETQIKSLGNLQSVGGNLFLERTLIKSLGNLQLVGGDLFLERTPLSNMYTEKQIHEMVDVGGVIFI